jgi:very-short-patch-repair endonuclease
LNSTSGNLLSIEHDFNNQKSCSIKQDFATGLTFYCSRLLKITGCYIADFVCSEKKLIIEVDGGQHMDAIEYDQKRTAHLIKLGYNVLRVWNNEVFNNIEGVLATILSSLENRAT